MAIATEHYEITHLRARPGMSPNERWTGNGIFQAFCQYHCTWADRNTLIAEMAAENGGSGQLYPHNPGSGARLVAANAVGWSRTSTNATNPVLSDYESALVTAFYSTDSPFYNGQIIVSEELRGNTVMIPIPPSTLRIGSLTGAKIPTATSLTKAIAGLEYIVTFYHVANPPFTLVSLLDHCNSTLFQTYTLNLAFSPETVWYRHPVVQRTIKLGGTQDFTVRITYAIRPESWNKWWFPGETIPWQYVYNTRTGNQVIFHPLANINPF